MMDMQTKIIEGSETGRTTVTGSNVHEMDKGGSDFKRGVFAGVSCLYRKNTSGQFEVFAPHIGVVNSHHETPQGFGRWLGKFKSSIKKGGQPWIK